MYNVTHITCICRIKLLLHSRIQLIECASEYKRITVFANTYSYSPPCIRDTNRIRHLVYSFQPYWIQCCIKTYIYLFYHQHPVKCYQALAVIWEKMMCNRPFPPTFAICRNCQKLRYWVGFVGVLSVNAGERRSPSERSNPAYRVCIN